MDGEYYLWIEFSRYSAEYGAHRYILFNSDNKEIENLIEEHRAFVDDSAKKPPKHNYTTTHLLQQQHKLMQRKSPRLAKSNTLSTVPNLINGKQYVSVKETGTVRRKLNLEDEKDDDTEENEADVEAWPETDPLEDFKMLLNYWGDESVQALVEDNAARRKTLSEIHTMGPKTHAQAKEKMRKKDSNLAKPSNAEIYLETYKRKPGRTYKTNTDEVKYAEVQALVDAGKIAEANALVVGGKTHGQNWLVGRQGKKCVKNSTPAPTENYVQELTTKRRQDLEADLEAKVDQKVQENMSLMLKKLREANPDFNFDIGPLSATPTSGQDDNNTPTTQGGTEF
ncbi:hypothetical protein POM88_007291 [Heracleum sosnowskyi]|uniref:Transposase n=1 Tax=Heracleum sosnowskyi TaxID=360622 RepID=A0AAD8N7E8_9APIA|nr:hypothetical protein POM88_007291 [Heracleum sosnowskyi]